MSLEAIVCLLLGCNPTAMEPSSTPPPIYGGVDANPPVDAMATHLDGTLDDYQVMTLFNLQFPQSYRAIISRLGSPSQRTESADWYQLHDGRWVKVWYYGSTATGFTLGEW